MPTVTVHRRRLTGALLLGVAFLLGAVGLAAWMVVLGRSQRSSGLAHRVPLLEAGMVALLAVALRAAGSAPMAARRSAAVFAATSAATIAWFLLVPFSGHIDLSDILFAVLVLPVAVTAAALLAADGRPGGPRRGRRPIPRRGIAVLAAVLVLAAGGPVAFANPSELLAAHLPLTWIGLDVAELIGVTGVGVGLIRWDRLVPPFAAGTAALLACDAWANVMSATRRPQQEAAAMAIVEVSVAALCLVLAIRADQSRAAARRT